MFALHLIKLLVFSLDSILVESTKYFFDCINLGEDGISFTEGRRWFRSWKRLRGCQNHRRTSPNECYQEPVRRPAPRRYDVIESRVLINWKSYTSRRWFMNENSCHWYSNNFFPLLFSCQSIIFIKKFTLHHVAYS